MAMLANRVWAWVFQGTAQDRRTGFVEMSDAEARGGIVGGRMQDPMVGAWKLKFPTKYIAGGMDDPPDPPPGDDEPPPEPEPDPECEPESDPPQPAPVARRRGRPPAQAAP